MLDTRNTGVWYCPHCGDVIREPHDETGNFVYLYCVRCSCTFKVHMHPNTGRVFAADYLE